MQNLNKYFVNKARGGSFEDGVLAAGWKYERENTSALLTTNYPSVFFSYDPTFEIAEVVTMPSDPVDIHFMQCRFRGVIITIATFEISTLFPQIILDSTKGTIVTSNLPVNVKPNQFINLEGDFGKYFDVYGPKNYSTEVLDLLSPDLMSLMIDNAAMFDIEIYGNRVYIKSNNDSFNKPEELETIYKAALIVANNIYREAQHWTMVIHNETPPTLEYFEGEESVNVFGKRFTLTPLLIPIIFTLSIVKIGGDFFYSLKRIILVFVVGLGLMLLYILIFRKPIQDKWKK